MRPAATLTAFAAGLTVVFVAALGLGSAVGPVAAEQPTTAHVADAMPDGQDQAPKGSDLSGLAVSDAGWTLHLADDMSTVGPARPFRFTVTGPDGDPEARATSTTGGYDLQPYLGAYGHLVALRAGDRAFLHTHPTGDVEQGRTGGPDISFGTTFPTAGSHRLFLDFRVGGTVRTAAFTVDVGEAP